MARDAWVVGPGGVIHCAMDGVTWACNGGSGGVIIGDVVAGADAPYGTCPECGPQRGRALPAAEQRAALPAGSSE